MLLKKFCVLCSGIILVLSSFCINAKEQNVTIKMIKIEAVKTVEDRGDELYFSITQHTNKEEPKLFRVPMFPLHWLSKELPEIKNISIWKAKLADNQSILVMLSLMEQDLEPWNSDDHIGSVQVQIINDKGKISTKWGRPHLSDQPEVKQPNQKQPKFVLMGHGAEYKVEFTVESHDSGR
mgnify:CR=1 FL=1